MMLIKRELRTQITSLKRCKAEGPASSSGDGPTGGDEPYKKRMRPNTVQVTPATSVFGAEDEVEAGGRSSRTRARAVPSRFKDSSVKEDNSSNGDIVLVPKKSKLKSIVPKHAIFPENDAVNEESRMKERVAESRKRDDPCLLEELEVGEVVWAKSGKTSPPWPAIVIDPREHAPEVVLNACVPSAICVMYFGHSANGNRDYGWVKAGMIFPFLDNVDRFQGQKPGKLRARFVAAIEEAFLAERGFVELGSRSAQGPADSDSADVVPGSSHGQEGSSNGGNGTCKGCGRTISFTKNRKSESDEHLCIECSKISITCSKLMSLMKVESSASAKRRTVGDA
ncbi:Histone-lysine N-methyltransferase ATX4 [Carex littledalei]|uniref:Histone-lysine N-methyltransferase ATX4 n=1 Tax=Carex littledalei TaxID=544730 RepID=A0A833VMG5_9POAL|nr:Histone-lysine N-methyltransferase ATX4 [Carex littledalei]